MGHTDVSGLAGVKPRMNHTLLFVVNVDWFFLSHRLPIALEAKRQGYEVHIATAITDRLDELRQHGLVVHPLILARNGFSVANIIYSMIELRSIFMEVRPDLVHLVTIKPILMGGLMARVCKVPSVVIAVSGLGFIFISRGIKSTVRRFLIGILYRSVLGHSNVKVIFQNMDDQETLTKLTQLPASKREIIRGSGVDLAKFISLPLPYGVPVVVMAARLLVDKGVFEFVEAARLLKKSGCLARFVLVGVVDIANPASLTTTEYSSLMDGGIVECWGHRIDMQQVLSLAQVVVLPSYREGLPKILLEAAACGRAVLTTDVPGCRDAIIPGITGLLVPARDVGALADAMQILINNPVSCNKMGSAGRLLAEHSFDVKQVVAKHLCLYKEMILRS
jgi:glycosyltransferase involved in cell wall biosynthesis